MTNKIDVSFQLWLYIWLSYSLISVSLKQSEADKLVFLDKSGVNTDLSRRYGRAIGGERSVDKVPLNTPENTTIPSSVRPNGETAYTIYNGGTTREKFLDYLKNVLIPTLHTGDIVVMDNMRTHHVKEVRTLLQEAGLKLLYLPACSPDLNPIENMWSKIKAILRFFASWKAGLYRCFGRGLFRHSHWSFH